MNENRQVRGIEVQLSARNIHLVGVRDGCLPHNSTLHLPYAVFVIAVAQQTRRFEYRLCSVWETAVVLVQYSMGTKPRRSDMVGNDPQSIASIKSFRLFSRATKLSVYSVDVACRLRSGTTATKTLIEPRWSRRLEVSMTSKRTGDEPDER